MAVSFIGGGNQSTTERLGLWCLTPLSIIYQLIVAVSFIGGGNQSTTERLGLWCLTSLSIIFQLYHGSQLYWWRKTEYPVKTTVKLLQVHLFMSGNKTHKYFPERQS